MSREHALSIWQAAVDAVRPEPLVAAALQGEHDIRAAPRILVVGAGKAGAGMALGLEAALADRLDRVEGLVNVPEGSTAPLKRVRLHPARPPGVNEPTAAGVTGAIEMLQMLAVAGPEHVAVCLLSGGGSALLPAPVEGITLADKLSVTRLLHRSGATIDEMNCVRKHLSAVKGGRLSAAFRGRFLLSLIISDVVGDPLDVIASGPTATDRTDFANASIVLGKYGLLESAPRAVIRYLNDGAAGLHPETLKECPTNVSNRIIGSNRISLDAAKRTAEGMGYRVIDLGAFVEGETREVAVAVAGIVRSLQRDGVPIERPACILIGGETTVTLGDARGKGGRNQEFVLALLDKLSRTSLLEGITILSAGTDGEDGPTDAAGAVADADTLRASIAQGLWPDTYLRAHDAYHFFGHAGGLIKTGLTCTNVMDVRVVLVR